MALAERLAHSPPTKANGAQSPAGSSDFRKWESAGFLGDLASPPFLSFPCRNLFTSITLIGSQDLAVDVDRHLNAWLGETGDSRENTQNSGIILNYSHVRSYIMSSIGMKERRKWEIPEKNPPTKGIVQHDSHLRKSGLIGPLIFPGRLTGVLYLQVLQEELLRLHVDIPLAVRRRMIFQYDLLTTTVLWLNTYMYISWRWIRPDGFHPWPPRSPYLSPLDYCTWGWMKDIVTKGLHKHAMNYLPLQKSKRSTCSYNTEVKADRSMQKNQLSNDDKDEPTVEFLKPMSFPFPLLKLVTTGHFRYRVRFPVRVLLALGMIPGEGPFFLYCCRDRFLDRAHFECQERFPDFFLDWYWIRFIVRALTELTKGVNTSADAEKLACCPFGCLFTSEEFGRRNTVAHAHHPTPLDTITLRHNWRFQKWFWQALWAGEPLERVAPTTSWWVGIRFDPRTLLNS
ncbi:hypothetical protein PR048_013621 [Dryococelus australis]|uniref:Uncharacterized protein n=1 Tax=Dryococelus australis TaxID=614101 RepID=A0ABQ9HTJ0_9NEOP|nr:hypothetical protein PR048_013621 [Dryococelus australis]